MANKPLINLFRTNSGLSPLYQMVMKYFRLLTLIILGVLLSASLVTFIFYTILSNNKSQLTQEKERLQTLISDAIVKEGMLFDMRQRLAAIALILKDQKSPTPYIDTMQSILQGSQLQSLSIGEKNSVSLTMTFPAIANAVPVIEKIIELTDQKKIRTPKIESFNLDRESGITTTVSYIVPIN